MKTILITSQKGGSGKTTLAAHLAVAAIADGAKAALIDTDPQGTLSRWHERREALTPTMLELPFAKIDRGLAGLRELGMDYCVIDTPGMISAQSQPLMTRADLIVIPVRPSPADLWAVAETIELARAGGSHVRYLFVISQANPRRAALAQAVAALSAYGTVAESFINDRAAYASALIDGRTAQELAPRGAAAAEVAGLWSCVKTAIQHSNRNTKAENNEA